MAIPAPGGIFFLPPYSTELDDRDCHPHVLLATDPGTATGVFIYGSSSDHYQEKGAPCLSVAPSETNGLSKQTLFYGPVLVSVLLKRLPKMCGKLVDLNALRSVVRDAIGCNSGSAYDLPSGTPSLRGRVVEITGKRAAAAQTRYFAIPTCHEYSRSRQNQIVVPLYAVKEAPAASIAPSVKAAPWMQSLFGKETTHVVAGAHLSRTVWDTTSIKKFTPSSIDASFLRLIEQSLCRALSL